MAKLAIKGHPTRGKEVIEILEMLGGANLYSKSCSDSNLFCYLSDEKRICELPISESYREITLFTLEEFLEKYPYKVGDKVSYVKYGDACSSVYTILRMWWTGTTIEYLLDSSGFSALTKDLQPYKEEIMEEKNDWAKWDLPEGYEFQDREGNVINTDVIKLVKKQSQYPKTYEECCNVLNISSNGDIIYGGIWVYGGEYLEKHLDRLRKFQQLLICRDAYWKMAGDQMGLGKPWEPRCDDGYQRKWIIFCQNGINFTNCFKGHFVLAFSTAEMRDAFYENFKELIELCKELL